MEIDRLSRFEIAGIERLCVQCQSWHTDKNCPTCQSTEDTGGERQESEVEVVIHMELPSSITGTEETSYCGVSSPMKSTAAEVSALSSNTHLMIVPDVVQTARRQPSSSSRAKVTKTREKGVQSSGEQAKRWQCNVCGQSLAQKSSMASHERIHTGEKPFACETCGKSFGLRCSLIRHRRTHSGEKPFVCETCGKSFGQSSILQRHRRTHTGEKPFGCEICGRAFNEGSALVEHRRIHTGEKPFGCEVCGKTFSTRGNYRKHHRTHTKEKPFECKMCGKFFAQISHLYVHRRRMHTRKKSLDVR